MFGHRSFTHDRFYKKSRAGSQFCFDFDRTGTGFCTLEARGMWPQDQIPSWCWKQNMASVTQLEADMCWSWSGPQRHISPKGEAEWPPPAEITHGGRNQLCHETDPASLRDFLCSTRMSSSVIPDVSLPCCWMMARRSFFCTRSKNLFASLAGPLILLGSGAHWKYVLFQSCFGFCKRTVDQDVGFFTFEYLSIKN